MRSGPDPAPPVRAVGGYVLKRRLGSGGFGVVYEGRCPETGRRAAVKLLRPETAGDALQRARFRQEAQVLERLRHPGLGRLLATESLPDGGLALVMEYLDGVTLRERLRGGPLPVPAALRWAAEAAAALAHAHAEGVVHRDVKPENLMLVPAPDEADPGRESVRVLDFGIARGGPLPASAASATQPETAEGARLGTPRYVAPEQLDAPRAVTGRADVFSLGVVLYEMLTGATPPGGAAPVPPPSARNRDVPAWLDRLVLDMLSPEPAARPTMAGVAALAAPLPAGRCPFPGLEPFGEDQAPLYCGRDAEVAAAAALLGGCHGRRWLQIEGASGSGKSSLLRAGLLPTLLRDGLPGGLRPRHALCLRPGRQPLLNLAQALLRPFPALAPDLGALRRRLADPTGLRDALREAAAPGEVLVLGLDQFEELLVMAEEAEAAQLDRLLGTALDDQEGPLRLVTTVRSDFLGRLSALPALERRLNEAARFHLPPLGEAGLREAVLGPCARAGLRCEPGLPERIVADAAGLGALPLLGHALRALYEARQGDLLTLGAYERLGGVAGALGRATDALLDGLGAAGGERARRLLLSLVRTGRGLEDARRARTLAEALGAAGGDAEAERVLQRLSGGRDPQAPGATAPVRVVVSSADRVELIHEALLVHMPALRRWIDEDRRLLERREDLEAAAAVWQEMGCPSEGLAQGATLAYFTGADLPGGAAERLAALAGPLGQRYLAASQRQAAEAAAAAVRRRRRRRCLGLIQSAAALVFLVVAGLAGYQTWRVGRLAGAALAHLDGTLRRVGWDLEYLSGTREVEQELLALVDGVLPDLTGAAGRSWRTEQVMAVRALRHGDFARRYGALADAERHYREALHRAQTLEGMAPEPSLARDLRAEALLKTGNVLASQGYLARAHTPYQALEALLQERRDAQSLRWRAEAAWRGAMLHAHEERASEAEAGLRSAAALLRPLGEQEEHRGFLLYHQCVLAIDRGDLGLAEQRCEEGLALQRSLFQKYRGYAIYPWHLARLLAQRAILRARRRDTRGAARDLGEALAVLQQLTAENGRHRRYRLALLETLRAAAEVAEAAGDTTAARGHLGQAVAIGEAMLGDDPGDGAAAHELLLAAAARLRLPGPPEERQQTKAAALRERLDREGRWQSDRHLARVAPPPGTRAPR